MDFTSSFYSKLINLSINTSTSKKRSKKIKMSVSCNSLPPEMVVRIFQHLNLTEMCRAQLVCKRWKEIIEKFNLVKEATGNTWINRGPSFFC